MHRHGIFGYFEITNKKGAGIAQLVERRPVNTRFWVRLESRPAPTLSDESINRGPVCVARIPSYTDLKDPDAHVLDG